jgi:hypothetical protein
MSSSDAEKCPDLRLYTIKKRRNPLPQTSYLD